MESVVKHKVNELSSKIKRFVYSVYYPALVSLWAFFSFSLNQQTLGLFVMIFAAGFILIFNKDLLPIIPLFANCLLTVNVFSLLTTTSYIIAYSVLGVCFIYHFIRFPFKNFYLGKLFFPLCLISAALFLGGILSRQGLKHYGNGLTVAFSTGPLVLIIYLLFVNSIDTNADTDIKKYVSASLIAATVCACIEIFFIYLQKQDIFFTDEMTRVTGWSNFNTVGAMTLIAIPLCCYLIVKTGKFAALFTVIIFMIATDVLCSCDGGTGISIFSMPFWALFVFINLKKRDRMRFAFFIALIIVALCAVGIFIIYKFGIDEVLSFITNRTDGHGRSALYENAIKLFKENPILGIGQGYADESSEYLQTYNFHSTPLHVMATMGIFGLIAYSIYYFFRFKILLGGRTTFNVFAYLSFIAFEAYGLIDVCEFNIIPLMSFMTLVILTTELSNMKGEEFILPLKNSTLHYSYFSL